MTDDTRTSIKLTDEEMVILDGRVGAKAQTKVDAAKRRLDWIAQRPDLSPPVARLIADVITEALTFGRLRYRRLWTPYPCDVCGKKAAPIRYKSGYRAGQIKASGRQEAVDMGDSRIEGFVALGACSDCMTAILPELQAALANVRAQMPAPLTATPDRWRWYQNAKCKQCGWEGHEGQMIWARTLFNDGWYPSECPECGAANVFGSVKVERRDGFEVTDQPIVTTRDRRKAEGLP